MADRNSEIIVVRDGVIRSVISDIVSFGILISLMFFNFIYWNGHWYVTIFIMFLWLVMVVGRGLKNRHEFQSAADAIKYLEEFNR